MDAIDEKIIEMLRLNSRESFATIGKSLDLSPQAIGKRVKLLENQGVILGYSLRLNHEKLGYNTKAYITLKVHQSSTIRTAYNQIKTFDEVESCDQITGDSSLCIIAYFKNNKGLVYMLERISHYGVPSTSIVLDYL